MYHCSYNYLKAASDNTFTNQNLAIFIVGQIRLCSQCKFTSCLLPGAQLSTPTHAPTDLEFDLRGVKKRPCSKFSRYISELTQIMNATIYTLNNIPWRTCWRWCRDHMMGNDSPGHGQISVYGYDSRSHTREIIRWHIFTGRFVCILFICWYKFLSIWSVYLIIRE